MNTVVRYKQNEIGKDYVVGDIHGCLDVFHKNLQDIEFDTRTDRIFSVGDLVDRGEKSFECLKLIEEPWFHAVKGNHEVMMLDALVNQGDYRLWHMNGGDWCNKLDDGEREYMEKELIPRAMKLPLAIEVETDYGLVGICHAEPPKDWESLYSHPYEEEQRVLWGRTRVKAPNSDWHVKNIAYTIHGHTPLTTAVKIGNSFFIDTGAVFDGMELLNGKTLQGELTFLELSALHIYEEELDYHTSVKQKLKKDNKKLI